MTDNITSIDESRPPDPLVASVEALKRQLPALEDYEWIAARLRRASYDAHIAEGFDEYQSLELCKLIGLTTEGEYE